MAFPESWDFHAVLRLSPSGFSSQCCLAKMRFSARAALITSTAEATGVNIATWFLATTFLIMYISRQIVKFVMLRKFQLDDYFMTAATVCLCVQISDLLG